MKSDTGKIVLVRFPFTSLEKVKKRPALVINTVKLSTRLHLSTIAMITSQIDKMKIEGDCMIENWESANLLHPSLVRLAKLTTIESDLIEREFGRLSRSDLERAQKGLQKLFRHWL